MSKPPCVSVLMPVFNNAASVQEAISSILSQTLADFEFIIVDDGSTDASWDILNSCHDPRIRLVRNERNLGVTRSLNRGLNLAQGEYIARQDADDISLPQRLERQTGLLQSSPQIGLTGSHCAMIDAEGVEQGILRKPVTDLEIRWSMCLDNPFVHPSVLVRRKVLEQHNLTYDERFETAQDYELWTRLLQFTRGANYDGILLKYRTGQEQVTATKRQAQLGNHDLIAFRTIREQLPDFALSQEQTSLLRALFVGNNDLTPDLDRRRVPLTTFYFALLQDFARRHEGEPGIEMLQGREALKMIRVVCRLPLKPGWLRVCSRIMFRSPGLIPAAWASGGNLLRRLKKEMV